MGRLIKSKKFGKNIRVNLYYFRDGYRIYARRRDNNKGIDSWIESGAASYAIQDKKEAIKELNEYRNIGDVLATHPVLRDEGTSMSRGFSYKIKGYR
jgi:hypothetical protein